jgi:hypothetical protein
MSILLYMGSELFRFIVVGVCNETRSLGTVILNGPVLWNLGVQSFTLHSNLVITRFE